MCPRLALCALLLLLPAPAPAWRSDTVKAWGRSLGEELWGLNAALTKSDQIKVKYKQMNASVRKKFGEQILESSLRSVGTMLTKKINAVKCIHAVAKNLARQFNESAFDDNFDYCSAKYSKFFDEFNKEIDTSERRPEFANKLSHYYKEMHLEKDSHFYNINVNTSISCVHVPTNIYFLENDTKHAIVWSKGLNEVFTQNYQADPSLGWQYFGSAHGMLRFYPAMPWNIQKTDTYDCRVQSWYIEAATCSKDVVILFDVSGSMTGFKNYVARTTLRSLLDTLSNNDYVIVYTFNKNLTQVFFCDKANISLVQATKENIETIRDILEPTDNGKKHKIPLDGYANLTKAYIQAFTTLKKRRKEAGCLDVTESQGCNQMVMVITDYVPGNLSEVFDEYNREVVDGKSYTPVRVFTYLIGKEVTNVEEIKSMACNNRGYYVHIHSVEEVQQRVLEYINVIARPMILNGSGPPPTWTHASIDETRTKVWMVSPDVDKPDEDKLVTSVAIPAFDTVANEDAVLLGVAGTDVPIDSIAKLAKPHQLGVNGYSFIVSNNGYLLLHPLLKTSINGELQLNYNSVDFVEVEQVDDGKGPRELGDEIQSLRQSLIHGREDSMKKVKVLFHYDDMRRIARVQHDYYFNKLEGTPFSMGISLPDVYGDTELELRDNPLEATQGKDLTGIDVTDYFRYSYRIHPDWVYCKYHYLEGHESEAPEIELWKFLVNISQNKTDISRVQYTEEKPDDFSVETHCGDARKRLDKDDYYCNEDLVKQLVFDAKLSAPYFKEWNDKSKRDELLADKYNVSVRFIMASSGLIRWHYLNDDTKNERVDDSGHVIKDFDGKVFGDYYNTGIEVTPYKAAVLQSNIDPESLVIATPLPVLDPTRSNPPIENDDGDITVTASYAIFYKDNGSNTPASVVGFQFSYKGFWQRFLEIINDHNSRDTEFSCSNGKFECFLVDSSGYVVLTGEQKHIGQFYGAVHPQVMQSLVEKDIFEHVEVYDYQALCPTNLIPPPDSSWTLSTPFTTLKWFLAEMILLLTDIYNWNQYAYAATLVMDEDAETTTAAPTPEKNESVPVDDPEDLFSCDHNITLYILNQKYFLKNTEASPVIYEDETGDCHPPYWASYVKNTNLLLVVVEDVQEDWYECPKPPLTSPLPTSESVERREPCHKVDLGKLPRRRLEGCYTYHEGEANLTACGRGTTDVAGPRVVATATLLAATARALLSRCLTC